MSKKIKKGQNLRLGFKDENDVLKYIAGALTFDLSVEADTEESTDKDSTANWKEYEVTSKGWSGSGQCRLADDAEDLGAIQGWDISNLVGEKLDASFDEVDGAMNRDTIRKRKYGRILITSWKITSANKEQINVDFSFTGDGPLNSVPAITGKEIVELHANGNETVEAYNIIGADALTASTDLSWLTVSVTGNNVVFKPTAYKYEDVGPNPREGYVVIRSGEAMLKVKVKQPKKDIVPGPRIDGASIVPLQADGTAVSRQYNVSDGSHLTAKSLVPWLSVSVDEHNLITFDAQPYAYAQGGDNPRETIVMLGVEGTSSSFDVTVKQAMAPAEAPIISGKTEVIMRTAGQTLHRQYATSDGSAIEAESDSDWLEVSVLNNKVTFVAAAYPYIPAGENPREAIVSLTVPGTTALLEVSVKQPMGAQPTISGEGSYEFEAEGGEKGGDYVASDGKAIEANCEADWLDVNIDSNGHLTIVADECPYMDEPRTAVITLTTETYAEKVISVSQEPGAPVIEGDDEISIQAIGQYGSRDHLFKAQDGSVITADSDDDWISVNIQPASGFYNALLTIPKYDHVVGGPDPRIGELHLHSETAGDKVVIVKQAMMPAPTITGADDIGVQASGDPNGTFKHIYKASDNSEIKCEVLGEVDWIDASVVEDTDGWNVKMIIPQNSESEERTATVRVYTDNGGEKMVTVTQDAAE